LDGTQLELLALQFIMENTQTEEKLKLPTSPESSNCHESLDFNLAILAILLNGDCE